MAKLCQKIRTGIFCTIIFFSFPTLATQSPESDVSQSNNNSISNDSKIQDFLQKEAKNLSKKFPYRINLFNQGQIDKNAAGVRIAETAKQFITDNDGLFFYYQVYDNSMRVPHWHANAMEIGTVLNGKMRVTIWEGTGKAKMFTVEKNGTWIIPQAALHSLENAGPGEMDFVVAYDSPVAADRDFLTAWSSLPDDILARVLGLTPEEIKTIKKTTINRLSSFDPSAVPSVVDLYSLFSNNFNTIRPLYQTDLGSIVRIDAKVNPKMKSMALQQTTLKTGSLRIPHWYTSGDVLLFVLKGNAFFTMMNDAGEVFNSLIERGDLISIPKGNFHGFLNTGQEDLVVYEAFNNVQDEINEITLMEGTQHFSIGTIEGATKLSKQSVEKVAQEKSISFIMAF